MEGILSPRSVGMWSMARMRPWADTELNVVKLFSSFSEAKTVFAAFLLLFRRWRFFRSSWKFRSLFLWHVFMLVWGGWRCEACLFLRNIWSWEACFVLNVSPTSSRMRRQLKRLMLKIFGTHLQIYCNIIRNIFRRLVYNDTLFVCSRLKRFSWFAKNSMPCVPTVKSLTLGSGMH